MRRNAHLFGPAKHEIDRVGARARVLWRATLDPFDGTSNDPHQTRLPQSLEQIFDEGFGGAARGALAEETRSLNHEGRALRGERSDQNRSRRRRP